MAANGENSRLNWGLSPIAYDGVRTPEKALLFVMLCLAWVMPGLIGHDPWKSDEAVIFGAVTEMLRSGDWIALRVSGEPLLDKAPLVPWIAAALAKLLGGWLAPHDAARLTSGLFMSMTLASLTLA